MKKTFLFLCALCALPLSAKTPRRSNPQAEQPALSAYDLLNAAWQEATGDTAALVIETASPAAVNDGYGTVSAAEAPLGAQQMELEELTTGGTPMERVNGRAKGVEVISGQGINEEAIITFRTAPSLFCNATPLYVIDGIEGADPHSISEQDIESVTILRDAAAAIYGSRGANGVIVVTTRKTR